MDFYEMLQEKGQASLLHRVQYSPIDFYNQSIVNSFLDEMQEHPEASVFIYGDYDVDGAMSAEIMLSCMKKLGVKNLSVFKYRKRTHDLDKEAVRFCIQNKMDYFLIADTASSDINSLKQLVAYGVKVLVIDHHVTVYDYENFNDIGIAIINSTIENSIIAKELYKLSAGALTFCVFDNYFRHCGLEPLTSEAAYALVSLYADCMDMSNIINRSIYYLATELNRSDLPKHILHFMNEYQILSARFIGYWFSPRINALFRSENFDVLNSYLFEDCDTATRIELIEKINKIYEGNKQMVKLLSDLVEVEVLEHFVICDLQTAAKKYNSVFPNLQNYTGLVANKLSTRYGKTAVVYCSYQDVYKGSVRDPYSRYYLPIFQQLCYAGGHGPAFGLLIKPFELADFLKRLLTIDRYFHIEEVDNEPIIIDYNYSEPDEGLIEDIALYNEFSGNFLPVIYLRKQLIGNMSQKVTSYYFSYDWGSFFIQSEFPIEFGQYMIIKPVKGLRIKLLTQI